MVTTLLFYAMAAVSVACALGVVVSRSPMQSVLNLLGSFLALAVVYLLMGFQFLATAQVLVYAGAIMVLFLFVVMLLNLTDKEPAQSWLMGLFNGRVLGSLASFLGLAALGMLAAGGATFEAFEGGLDGSHEGGLDPIYSVAEVLFSKYMLPFEAASVLLLATMVGVMLLAKRERGEEDLGQGGGAA
ncbi:MAG: NADH-quinone oxidoreductase subunit J [Planctomycetota bacterium]|nr:NADH-quinone oxidoreductase subunit J [Planctomycetota bacterium]